DRVGAPRRAAGLDEAAAGRVARGGPPQPLGTTDGDPGVVVAVGTPRRARARARPLGPRRSRHVHGAFKRHGSGPRRRDGAHHARGQTVTAGGADDSKDLGFGAVVTRESRLRLLNRDGTFNVRRRGLEFFESLSAYHTLLTLSWPRFLLLVAAASFAANLVFATASP